MRRTWLALVLGACNFDSSAGPPVDGDSVGSSDDGDDAVSDSAGAGRLVLSDGPGFDFGYVDVGQFGVHRFELTNEGDSAARGLTPTAPEAPFDWAGGLYPGTNGTCTDTLPAGQTCTIAVELVPVQWGRFESLFEIRSGAGGVARAIEGGGADRSPNLVANGAPDQCPMDGPPTGWTAVEGDGWQCWDGFGDPAIEPVEGGWLFDAGFYPGGGTLRLSQHVDLSSYRSLVAEGFLRFEFAGHARSHDPGDDDYRVSVEYLAEGQVLDGGIYDTGWKTSAVWTDLADDRVPPPGTDTVRIVLMCQKAGGEFCDAYFDDLSLHAVHP